METWLVALPFAIQGGVILLDEGIHRRRNLPRWERIGHPLDTLTLLGGLVLTWLPATPPNLRLYFAWAVGSCLFVTKDEWVHATRCSSWEHWLHALLFVLHPLVFISLGYAWFHGVAVEVRQVYFSATLAFFLYQSVYWNLWRKES